MNELTYEKKFINHNTMIPAVALHCLHNWQKPKRFNERPYIWSKNIP